jgi:hypothetical protein
MLVRFVASLALIGPERATFCESLIKIDIENGAMLQVWH